MNKFTELISDVTFSGIGKFNLGLKVKCKLKSECL